MFRVTNLYIVISRTKDRDFYKTVTKNIYLINFDQNLTYSLVFYKLKQSKKRVVLRIEKVGQLFYYEDMFDSVMN